jgi:hypothetical protein
MNTIRRSLAVLAGGVVVVCGAVYLVKTQRESERRYESLRLEMEELRQVGATSAQRVLQPQIVRLIERTEKTQDPPKGNGTDERVQKAEESKRPKAEMTGLEMAGKFRNAFAMEQKDPAWSADTEKKVSATFSDKLKEGSLIQSLECHSTMCLVELQYKTLQQFQDFVHDALVHSDPRSRLWGPTSAFVVDTDASGGVSAMVALAREGNELPPTE